MKCMADFRCIFVAVLFVATPIPSRVQAQSRETTRAPDRFEFFEGHGYMGGTWVKWERDKLVLVKRVADMTGKGSLVETTKQLSPTRDAWQRFWARIDSLGIWQWKSDYTDPKCDGPDGESWALTLRRGAKQMKSNGYNAVPDPYGEFRDAVYNLMADGRHHERE
jgi:hypothetical protein